MHSSTTACICYSNVIMIWPFSFFLLFRTTKTFCYFYLGAFLPNRCVIPLPCIKLNEAGKCPKSDDTPALCRDGAAACQGDGSLSESILHSWERRGVVKQQRSITGTHNIYHGLRHTNKVMSMFRYVQTRDSKTPGDTKPETEEKWNARREPPPDSLRDYVMASTAMVDATSTGDSRRSTLKIRSQDSFGMRWIRALRGREMRPSARDITNSPP